MTHQAKSKVTSPVDSYTVIIQVQHCSNYLRLVLTDFFLGGVEDSNGGVWPCEIPSFRRISDEWVHGLIQLAKSFPVCFIALWHPHKNLDYLLYFKIMI